MSPSSALIPLFSLACLTASTCSSPLAPAPSASLTIVAYNVLSLFDAKDDGDEFPEFSVAKGTWDDARYRVRLANVAKAVYAAVPSPGPDILCLEEIENRDVLEALRTGPLSASRYGYAAIAPSEGGPFSDCVLSRLPLVSASCLGASTPAGKAGRNMLELELDTGGDKLFLFSCHWKSKVEGDEATEEARREDAALLRSRIQELLAANPGARIAACGDFNESPDEYLRVDRRYPTALMPVEEAAGPAEAEAPPSGPFFDRLLVASKPELACPFHGEPALYSPWADSGGYSYSFRGKRERLDGFLIGAGLLGGAGLHYKNFAVADASFLLDAQGAPLAWPGTGENGYSDHLPVALTLTSSSG
jgi:endonuclease/exonuclease/phosphatase family metal-dependent hydrolase